MTDLHWNENKFGSQKLEEPNACLAAQYRSKEPVALSVALLRLAVQNQFIHQKMSS
jgi:hypothetical protein